MAFFVCKGCCKFALQWLFFFCLQLKKGSGDAKKIRSLSKEEIKQQLIDSVINTDMIKTEELNEKADKEEISQDSTTNITQCDKTRETLYVRWCYGNC